MKISIVIPTYNEEKYIGRTLQSINKLDKNNWWVEVVVIDAHSTDKTRDSARSYGARVMDIIHRGIGYARQQGIEHAKGEIVAFTDADTMVPRDWLIKHIEALNRPNVVLSYGLFKLTDGTFPYYHFINYILMPVYKWLTILGILRISLVAGQNMAFWREKAQMVGGFDTSLHILEDNDFARRMSKIGKVYFSKDLWVFSSGRRSAEGWGVFIRVPLLYIKYFLVGKKNLGGFPDYR